MVKLMRVPKSIFREVGPAGDVHKLMNDFFINAKEYIQCKLKNSEDHFFEIKYANLAYHSENVNSDNRLVYLEFKEKYVAAGMLETRTAFNNLQFTFFRDLSCLENRV